MPDETLHRTFETAGDRDANRGLARGRARQRSHSIEVRYRSGSIDRLHVHDNLNNGNPQFEHVIGGWDRNGRYWGRQDENGG